MGCHAHHGRVSCKHHGFMPCVRCPTCANLYAQPERVLIVWLCHGRGVCPSKHQVTSILSCTRMTNPSTQWCLATQPLMVNCEISRIQQSTFNTYNFWTKPQNGKLSFTNLLRIFLPFYLKCVQLKTLKDALWGPQEVHTAQFLSKNDLLAFPLLERNPSHLQFDWQP